MGCCRERPRTGLPKTLCQVVEDAGAGLAVNVVQTASGVQFEIAWAGRVFELFEAVRVYGDCRGAQARAIRALEGRAARLRALAAPLIGKTTTLGRLSLLV